MLTYLKTGLKELFIRPAGYQHSLDGLRALAIFMVVSMHVNQHYLHRGILTGIHRLPPFSGGWMGVPLFFILSGYLIGGQC
jgi:peptidoglycan/LPS O-acetylase OafA/YrhL